MTELQKRLELRGLIPLLADKRALYDQLISQEKEFDEVKVLFLEIRDLEKLVREKLAEHN